MNHRFRKTLQHPHSFLHKKKPPPANPSPPARFLIPVPGILASQKPANEDPTPPCPSRLAVRRVEREDPCLLTGSWKPRLRLRVRG